MEWGEGFFPEPSPRTPKRPNIPITLATTHNDRPRDTPQKPRHDLFGASALFYSLNLAKIRFQHVLRYDGLTTGAWILGAMPDSKLMILQWLKRIFRLIYPPVAVAITTLLISACQSQVPERPNIVILLTDDQRLDTMVAMPQTTALIFDQGVAFQNAYVTTARCCPSRSSILTGQYAHTHGVLVNTDPLSGQTVVESLHANGYRTGLVGKYLNSYPTQAEDPPRPEFDEWIAMISGNEGARYTDTFLNVNGEWKQHTGYQTHILRDYALDFIRDSAAMQEQPFFLLFAPYAPIYRPHPRRAMKLCSLTCLPIAHPTSIPLMSPANQPGFRLSPTWRTTRLTASRTIG